MKKILSQQSVEEDTFIFCDNYVIVTLLYLLGEFWSIFMVLDVLIWQQE